MKLLFRVSESHLQFPPTYRQPVLTTSSDHSVTQNWVTLLFLNGNRKYSNLLLNINLHFLCICFPISSDGRDHMRMQITPSGTIILHPVVCVMHH